MPTRNDLSSVLRIYCLARQAERSIDFALASSEQWELFRQYFDETRLGLFHRLVRELESSTPNGPLSIKRDRIPGITLSWVLSYPMRWLLNQFRISWTLSDEEMMYLTLVFRAF